MKKQDWIDLLQWVAMCTLFGLFVGLGINFFSSNVIYMGVAWGAALGILAGVFYLAKKTT